MKRCSHNESLSFKVCPAMATHKFRRALASTKAPWRYLCDDHTRLAVERNGSRDRIVVKKV